MIIQHYQDLPFKPRIHLHFLLPVLYGIASYVIVEPLTPLKFDHFLWLPPTKGENNMTCQGEKKSPKHHRWESGRIKHKPSFNSLRQQMIRGNTLLYLCPQLIPMNPATMY